MTCVGPRRYRGDLEPLSFGPRPDEPCGLATVSAWATSRVHTFFYGPEIRAVLRCDWDVIHAWEEPYIMAGFQLAKWANPDAAFVTWSAQNIKKRYPPPFSLFERRVLDRADGWLYCGHSVRDALIEKAGYRSTPSALGPLGVDTASFAPDAELRRRARHDLGWDDAGPPVVGYSGRFVAEKGVRLLIDALTGTSMPWRALFLGAGPLEAEIAAFASRFPGRVRTVRASHDEVPRYLNAMDVLCGPSQSTPAWNEQFGRMVVEAFACGVPVLSSDNGELPYVVADAGVILPQRDTEAWRRALEDLLASPARRAELSAAGLERARSEYAWSVVAARYLAFFEQVCARRQGAGLNASDQPERKFGFANS